MPMKLSNRRFRIQDDLANADVTPWRTMARREDLALPQLNSSPPWNQRRF